MKFNLSISRNSSGSVGIEVIDDLSNIKFLELDLTLEQYASVITGLSRVEVEGKTRGLEFVGKEKIVELRSITIPSSLYQYDKENVKKYIIDNHSEEGWTLDLYLGSQSSFKHLGDNTYQVNYSVYKYVEVK